MKKKYYRTFTEVYYAESDKDAVHESLLWAKERQRMFDNSCQLNSVVSKDFGQIIEKEIYCSIKDENNV